MKRIIIGALALLTIGASSCKKQLDERFYNPDQLSEGTTDIVPGLFTQTITTNKILVQDYGEWYYLLNGGTSITGYEQIAQRYISYRYDWFSTYNDVTTGNGFDDYPITGQGYFQSSYTRLKTWESIRNEVNARSGQDKLDANVYFKLVTLIKLYQSAKLVDLFNSIPYFDAFQGSNGTEQAWYPKYDDPKTVYESIITDLGHLVDSIPVVYSQMSDLGKQVIAQQDVVFKADMSKWVKFANATRLKLLVRIAGVDEGFAKPLIQETLSKPLPTADLDFPLWYQVDVLGGGQWQRGLYENTYASFIPNIIMKRLNYGTSAYEPGTDDPRLPVLAMPTKYKDYRGVSLNIDAQTPVYDGGDKYYAYADNISNSLSTNAKSMYSHITLHRNQNMPVYMFSLSELDLLLAEIALKNLGSTGKTADDHIKDAVVHSVNYWYRLNQLSTYSRGVDDQELYPTKPSDIDVDSWANIVKGKFTSATSVDDKMEILMQQKFIHLNLLHPYELWAELRRTGHPKLEPFTWHGSMMKPFPERVRYPGDEQTSNPTNFQKVAGENNMTSKIFWVPSNRNSVLYWDNYDYK